jgi:hypothetical protein
VLDLLADEPFGAGALGRLFARPWSERSVNAARVSCPCRPESHAEPETVVLGRFRPAVPHAVTGRPCRAGHRAAAESAGWLPCWSPTAPLRTFLAGGSRTVPRLGQAGVSRQQHRDRHVNHRSGYFADPAVRSMGADKELSGRRRDGTEFPLEISLARWETGQGTLVSAAIRDITERKLADEIVAKARDDALAPRRAEITVRRHGQP